MTSEYPAKSLVLAKVKGYPEWPACVVPEEDIPSNMTQKKPKTRAESVCVKFYFDDQYLWCSSANMKAIDKEYVREYLVNSGEEIPEGHDDFIDTTAGRRKRIVSAYLKAYTLPINEFINWGSWGPPKEPEEEEEDEFDEFIEEEVGSPAAAPASKKTGRGRGRPKRKATTTVVEELEKQDKKPEQVKSRRGRKRQKIEIDIPIIDDEEDEDFIEGEDEYEENEDLESDQDLDLANSGEDEDESDNNYKGKIDSDWGIEAPPKNPLSIDFQSVPDSKILNNEVNAMTSWCWRIRTEIQELLFPDDLTKLKDVRRKQLAIDMKKKAKEEAAKAKLPPSLQNGAANGTQKVKTEGTKEAEAEAEAEEATQNQQNKKEDTLPPINYRTVKKSLDPIIVEILDSDISKSILRSTGLNKIVLCILKTPELQTPSVQKLHKWWTNAFSYKVSVDERWGQDFTNEMHEAEEAERREKEEEKRRKRKEERRATPSTSTPDVEMKKE